MVQTLKARLGLPAKFIPGHRGIGINFQFDSVTIFYMNQHATTCTALHADGSDYLRFMIVGHLLSSTVNGQ
jgi:hypothetical protein